MDHGIKITLLVPHSSHLCQPLDVGIFSSLKHAMSNEMDAIMRYGVPNIKKFEWANSYRIARPKAFTIQNIKSGWSGTGLFPFNRHRVLIRIPEIQPLFESSTSSETLNPFSNIPETPSKLDSNILRSANTALITSLNAGALDTPTKKYIPQLASIAENLRAKFSILQHQYNEVTKILRKRKEHSTGKCVALKDQVLITTKELREKLVDAQNVMCCKRQKKGDKAENQVSARVEVQQGDVLRSQEEVSAINNEGL